MAGQNGDAGLHQNGTKVQNGGGGGGDRAGGNSSDDKDRVHLPKTVGYLDASALIIGFIIG